MSYRGGDRGRGRGGFPDRGRGGPPSDRGRGRGGFGGPASQGAGIFSPSPASDIDARLRDGTETSLVKSLQSLRLSPTDLPVRPDFGKLGIPVKLRTNYFPVKIPKGNLYEYDVSISPAAGSAIRRVRRRIFQLAEQSSSWPVVAHDHSSKIIAAKLLPQPLTIVVPFYDEDEQGPRPDGKEFTLTITFTQPLDMSKLASYVQGQPQYRGYDIAPLISALNIILATRPIRSGVLLGRNRFFFKSAAPPVNLGGSIEAWRGFYSSVRPTHNQLMVNVNVCTTAFYVPGNLAQAMKTFMNHSFGARLSVFAHKVRVKTLHLGHKKSVFAVSNMTPSQHKFRCEEFGNAEVTVETYFKRKYNITLKHPELPLVDLGSQKKSVLVPPELCEILPNQPYKGKLSDENTAAMMIAAAKPPTVNASAIVGPGLDLLGYRQGSSLLSNFGVSVGTEMAIVPGRILPPPNIKYGVGTPRVDEKASWNLRDVKFAKGGVLRNWVVLVIKDNNPRDEFVDANDPSLRAVMNGFIQTCKTSGIQVADSPHYLAVDLPPKDFKDPIRAKSIATIRTALQTVKTKPSFIFVVLSNGDKHIYSGLKHLLDVFLDVGSTCVHSAKIRKERGQLQYFANVALKVNMKLGGVNHTISGAELLLKKRTMLVGIDVTHPGVGTVQFTPSVAAVVASIDSTFAQFHASLEIQESRKEMVTNLDGMMVERLNRYLAVNKQLPQRILVYRDGVSEGQFPIVVDQEIPLIRKACRKFDSSTAKYQPELTIVICGKRHHTRFYPTEASGADANGNPLRGTVCDRGVTSVYEFDFFLQAHGALQGTSKPTHYYVVHDEIGFKADELQGLTNAVSYMFARATKAVSLVSPAYYADIACERGRCYLHRLIHGITSVNLKSKDAEALVMEDARSLFRGVKGPQLKDTMFYL
ncbi:argonaute-like protein [Mycena floridula]|nr:argonaute-like protein [Mycena floridula]